MTKIFHIIGKDCEAGNVSGGDGDLGFRSSTLTQGKSKGVQVVDFCCGHWQGRLIPTRGMGIGELKFKDNRIGWDSPIEGPVHPMWVPLDQPDGLGWLDGFDELLVRCGLVSNGAPQFDDSGVLKYGLHGRIANLPAQSLQVELDQPSGRLVFESTVAETRFHFHKLELKTRMEFQRSANQWKLTDTVSNLGSRAANIQMLYHWNFGSPLLGKDSILFAPIAKLAPRNEHAAEGIAEWNRYDQPTPGYVEQVYFAELQSDDHQQTEVLLCDRDRSIGVSMSWNTEQLPCFTIWKNSVAAVDGYVTGIEPGLNFPNPTEFEQKQGRTVCLSGGESHRMQTRFTFCQRSEIESAIDRIEALTNEKPVIESAPIQEWTA